MIGVNTHTLQWFEHGIRVRSARQLDVVNAGAPLKARFSGEDWGQKRRQDIRQQWLRGDVTKVYIVTLRISHLEP